MELTKEYLEEEKKLLTKEYKRLLSISYQTLSKEDKQIIRKAFDLAVEAHKDQRRKSGEAYIFHPVAVAQIVAAEIGLDATSICAALLHDVVEDTEYTLNDIEQLFGETVARIVDGLTKISHLKKDRDVSLQAENFRKMLLTINDDPRVIIIKIADRLHNMQTMDAMRPDKQRKIASETLYIYAPLAHRLGLYNIKTELEDLGLKYTEPEVHNDISLKIKDSKEQQDQYIKDFSKIIDKSLQAEGLSYEITGRPKSIFSIRRKLIKQGVSFEEVYDKFAVRIIYRSDPANEKFIAWKIYSIVTDHFRPNPTRLRDWISSPKSTGYEALHITVMGLLGRWVEVQIRSERMHEIAEKGYAAHYKYKQGGENQNEGLDAWISKLQEALEGSETNAVDFVENFKLNLYNKEIFVFTPKGELKSLPKGATPVDFAFSIHTEVGLKTRGARVNGKLVPLNHELKSGDQVDIITSEQAKPNNNWLDYATTARARAKIKSSLNEEKKEIAKEGKVVLARKLKSQKITLTDKVVNELASYFKLQTSQDLFYRVGLGTIDNKMIKEFSAQRSNMLVSFIKNKIRRPNPNTSALKSTEIVANYDALVFGSNQQKLNYTIAQCCKPIPGDKVFGFTSVKDGIRVHKNECPNAISMRSNFAYRVLEAKWIDSTVEGYKAEINLIGLNNLGLLNQVTSEISNHMHVDMTNINMTTEGEVFKGTITVLVKNQTVLNNIIQNIKKIKGIDQVTRT